MIRKFTPVISLLIVFLTVEVNAQKSRYRFAQTYWGIEMEYLNQDHDFQLADQDGALFDPGNSRQLTPRILIGGTHFWGHADFYISIPLSAFKLQKANNAEYDLSTGVLTSFRAYPWKIKRKGIRPHLGLGFSFLNYRETVDNNPLGQGPRIDQLQAVGEIGLGYLFGKTFLLDANLRYLTNTEFTYATSPTSFEKRDFNPWSFSLGIKKLMDFTAGYDSPAAQDYVKRLDAFYKEKKAHSAWSIAVGPSGLIPLATSEHFDENPALIDLEGLVYPDFGIGYYHQPIDVSFRLSYRPLRARAEAYGMEYRYKRNSLAFESFTFLGDYHGFVPFVGPYISYDDYRIEENFAGGTSNTVNQTDIGYGIVFGWDIRPTSIDWIILRTNLRYSPTYQIEDRSQDISFHQLEFNFIQLVYYPQRHKAAKQFDRLNP